MEKGQSSGRVRAQGPTRLLRRGRAEGWREQVRELGEVGHRPLQSEKASSITGHAQLLSSPVKGRGGVTHPLADKETGRPKEGKLFVQGR